VFTFVLMPQPVKPMAPGWRRVAWGYPDDGYLHDTSGWRYYGDGVNAFTLPTDEDYVKLGRVIAGEEPWPKNMNGAVVKHRRDDPRPYVLYGSSLMAGSGPANGEWDSYAAEWVSPQYARLPFDADVKSRFLGKRSYGGFEWKDDLSLKPASTQWTDSWLDFALYYQEKLVRLAGVNGTWFDNQSCFTIADFDADGLDRHLLENPNRFPSGVPLAERPFNYGRRCHTLQFREYLKRLATMCHLAGRPPFWMVNQHPTWSFAQIAWHIEADYYAGAGERDLIEHFGVESFRAHVRSQGGLIGRLHFAGPLSDQPPREGHPGNYGVRLDDATAGQLPGTGRTHTGLCLIHDTGLITGRDPLLLGKLDRQFGFFADGVEFQPYWEQTAVKAESDRVYISVYANTAQKKTLAVLFNEKKGTRGLTVPLAVADTAGGVAVKTVRDLETGEPLVDLRKGKTGFQTVVYVPPRDFRLLMLE
jgi:hypothetical protein